MSIQEKLAGFNYQDHQKYHQEAVEKYGQEVMDQAIERQKGHEDEATAAFNQVFQALAQNLQAGLPATATETKSKQANSCKPFVLMDLTALLRSSVISVKATSTTQNLRKTLTNLDLEQPSTHQMLLSVDQL